MPIRQDNLQKILEGVGKVTEKTISMPRFKDLLNPAYHDEIRRVYERLGGKSFDSLVSDEIHINLGNGRWDVEFDQVAVELDEERHFNKYRLITLDSNIYRRFKQFPLDDYRQYCDTHADECKKAASFGKNWTTTNSERQFPSLPLLRDNPNAMVNDAPRWKQRAFYDWLKDLTPLVVPIRLARIAIWDLVDVKEKKPTVDEILSDFRYDAADALKHLIEKRTIHVQTN